VPHVDYHGVRFLMNPSYSSLSAGLDSYEVKGHMCDN